MSGMANTENFAAACNTMVASKWTIWMARIFGQKVCTFDDWAGERTVITAYRYKGKLYLTHMQKLPSPQPREGS